MCKYGVDSSSVKVAQLCGDYCMCGVDSSIIKVVKLCGCKLLGES